MRNFFANQLTSPNHRRRFEEAPFGAQSSIAAMAMLRAAGLHLLKGGFRLGLLRTPAGDFTFDEFVLENELTPPKGDDEYLSPKQVEFFAEHGYVGPFRLMGEEQAQELHETIRKRIMTEPIVYGRYHDRDENDRQRFLKQRGIDESVVERGWYRHLNVTEMHDVLTSPKVAKKMASLLGEDVVLWRSQCFEVGPGSKGTGLHQTADFGMDGKKPTLQPMREVSNDSLIQLTGWVALTDATPENGCLVFIPGTHRTDYFVKSFNYRALMMRLAQQPLSKMLDALMTLGVANRFDRQVAHFEMSTWFYDNIFRPEQPHLFAKIRTIPMKAGEFVIFTSKMVHGSTPNVTDDNVRFALGGRYTTTDVRVMPNQKNYTDVLHFQPDKVTVPVSKLGVTQVHGRDVLANNEPAKLHFTRDGAPHAEGSAADAKVDDQQQHV